MEFLKGLVDSILFKDDEGSYSVLRVKTPDMGDVTVAGDVTAYPGEEIEVEGAWRESPRYGRYFRVASYITHPPERTEGIKKFLGSNLVKGIGEEVAGRIVKAFGEDSLRVIEEDPERLLQVKGIGKKRLEAIIRSYQKVKDIRKGMVFLCSCGLGVGYARKVVKIYGEKTEEEVRKNPYLLMDTIDGIGFKTADKIALGLGIEKHSTLRARAGILYVLKKASEDGNTCIEKGNLLERTQKELSIERDVLVRALDDLLEDRKVVEESGRVFLHNLHRAEVHSAENMARIVKHTSRIKNLDAVERFISEEEKRCGITLSKAQVEAVVRAVGGGISVITGGPGTGKTTVVRFIVRACHTLGKKVLLSSPTGRAAERLSEAAEKEAKTVHRLLEYDPITSSFKRGKDRPLNADLVIVDEASMLDITLFSHLLEAIPSGASLVLVGDSDQLPSVGPGNVLGDIVESGVVPVVRLDKLFRQKEESLIVTNAHRINRGLFPITGIGNSGFYLIERDDPGRALKTIKELYTKRMPSAFGLDPLRDIQVLSPMRKGVAGVNNINRELQRLVNPGKKAVSVGGMEIGVGDKVMQVKNNYNKDVFNGDIGVVEEVDGREKSLLVRFGRRTVRYSFDELGELTLSYASSVHKSQGSEHRAVIMVLLTQHYPMLHRNLLYTAVTRAKEVFVLVGSKKAVYMAVKNAKALERNTYLRQRLLSVLGRPKGD